MKRFPIAAAASGVLFAVIALQGAQAQTKPGKLVTRDELRTCMNSESELATRRKGMEARAAQQREEAAALRAESTEMAEEQKRLVEENKSMEKFERRVKTHNARIAAANSTAEAFGKDLGEFNKVLAAYNEQCGGISYHDEDKNAILKEREAARK